MITMKIIIKKKQNEYDRDTLKRHINFKRCFF